MVHKFNTSFLLIKNFPHLNNKFFFRLRDWTQFLTLSLYLIFKFIMEIATPNAHLVLGLHLLNANPVKDSIKLYQIVNAQLVCQVSMILVHIVLLVQVSVQLALLMRQEILVAFLATLILLRML